jgi:inner membrane protein
LDILTQGLLGASLSQSAARKEEMHIAAGVGFLSGMLADADVFISSSSDSLLMVEYHRHFTHSLVFIPFAGLIVALLLWPFLRKRMAFGRLFLLALLGGSLSGVLDACTSYGTHLFWPFIDTRTAWNLISIIDPIFTLALLLGVLFSLRKRMRSFVRYSLLFAACYMALGWLQLQSATTYAEKLIAERGHKAERLLVKPTLANRQLWRSIYQYDGVLYVDAVRLGVSVPSRVYEGASVPLAEIGRDFPNTDSGSVLYQDIKRFTDFSDGWIAMHPQRKEVMIDVRYSILPNSLMPLWGIEMDVGRPQQHAVYSFYRNVSQEERQQFIDMLLGREVVR